MDFSQIRILNGSRQKSFEELVCQLASRSKPENAKEFIRKDGAGGDAGVECYWKLTDGSEHAWQAKYFLNPLGPSQWKQISKSVESALAKHPYLTKYYVCLPRDRTDSRRLNKGKHILSELDRWEQHVKRWKTLAKEKTMQVEFVYWGNHEISSLLFSKDTQNYENLAGHWFSVPGTEISIPHNLRFPTEIIDGAILKETDILCKSQFFAEFDTGRRSLILARKLEEGDLRHGTDLVRCKSLAWCVRLLLRSDKTEEAQRCLNLAKQLGSCDELEIAEAFMLSQNGDQKAALTKLVSLTSSESRTSAFIVVARNEGRSEAVRWLEKSGFYIKDLDSEGRFILVNCHLQLGNWQTALEALGVLTDDDYINAPALHHLVAVTYLVNAVPSSYRTSLRDHPPLEVGQISLALNADAVVARREAYRHFVKAAEIAKQFNCPHTADLDDTYAVWLELTDPNEIDKALKRLESKLRGPTPALHLVFLGVQFGIEVDSELLNREIDQLIARSGQTTQAAALARLGLAFTHKNPKEVVAYIARYYEELADHFDKNMIQSIQIDMLIQADLPDRAAQILDEMIQGGLPEVEETRLRRKIAEAKGADAVTSRKDQFKESGDLSDLRNLAELLETKGDWEALCEYGTKLFEETHSLHDAERLALALYNGGKYEQLEEFLNTIRSLITRSSNLQLIYCWSLFNAGALLDAQFEMSKLRDENDNLSYRTLVVNVAIALGDRDALVEFVAGECRNAQKRNASELIDAAQLALRLNLSAQVKDLITVATEKEKDNPDVLASAFMLASAVGFDDSDEAGNWIKNATLLSGENGPLQSKTLKEFLDWKTRWARQQTEILRLLRRGEITMFGAAHVLSKSLIDLMLYPFYGNLIETDTRRRTAVFAFSGNKPNAVLNRSDKIVMDVSTILTLSSLELLEKALVAFETIYVTHSTLGWFFVEKQKAIFHQPSRITDARQIYDLIVTDSLEKLSSSAALDDELVDLVGIELAQLIGEAQTPVIEDSPQRIVVCPYPVRRLDSLIDEHADLHAYTGLLCSCCLIVNKLRKKGQISAKEEQRAYAYLQLHEKSWPNQREIADGAILYLTDLATTYFHHLGLLAKLKAAGFRPVVSPSVVHEVCQLISYEKLSNSIQTNIENIRSTLNTQISLGKVRIERRVSADQSTEKTLSEHPTNDVLSHTSHFDAIVVDDKSINLHQSFVEGQDSTNVFSSLDVIETLTTVGSISNVERLDCRMQLRKAGYILVPVDVDELIHHLDDASIENGEVVETAELKAIRENLLLVRLNECNLSVEEDDWLRSLFRTFREALKELWKRGGDLSDPQARSEWMLDAQARSDWILRQLELRIWAHCFERETGEHMVGHGYGAHVMSLLLLPFEELQEEKEDYWRWIEDRVLNPIKEQSPEQYLELVEWYRGFVAAQVDRYISESKGNGK